MTKLGADGEPVYDLADFIDFNERLILDAVNRERAEKKAEQEAKAKQRKGRRR